MLTWRGSDSVLLVICTVSRAKAPDFLWHDFYAVQVYNIQLLHSNMALLKEKLTAGLNGVRPSPFLPVRSIRRSPVLQSIRLSSTVSPLVNRSCIARIASEDQG